MKKKKRMLMLSVCLLIGTGEGAIQKETVVFVGAHPDDLAGEIGTALRLAEHYEVHVINFTPKKTGTRR